MKKFLVLLFTIIFLLCGCESNVIVEDLTATPELFTPAQTQPKVEKIFYDDYRLQEDSTFVLLEDGSVWFWGMFYKPGSKITKTFSTLESGKMVEKEIVYNDVALGELPQKFQFEGIDLKNNVKDIVCLGLATFVLLKDGDLYSFGANTVSGILGDGTTYDRATPKKILSGVSQIYSISGGVSSNYPPMASAEKRDIYDNHRYCQGYVMYALAENGDLYSWGYNWVGQLYDGTNEDSATPIKVQDNVKTLYILKGSPLILKNDGTIFLPTPLSEAVFSSTFKPAFTSNSEIYRAYSTSVNGEGVIGILYKNGELWHYNSIGEGSLFEKDVKEYDGSRFLKTDGTLYKYKSIDEAIKTDSNVKTITDGCVIYNDNSIYTFDYNGNMHRIENVLAAASNYHIDKETEYLYARGDCQFSSLGIEINPDEKFIEVPVQVLFPAGWNK